jgi:hypothetical protein
MCGRSLLVDYKYEQRYGLAARKSGPNPSPSVNNKEGGFESHPLRHKPSAKCRDRLSANQTVPVLEVQPHCRQTQIELFRVAAGQGFYVWYGPQARSRCAM